MTDIKTKSNKKLVIGLVGEMRSGKETFTKILQEIAGNQKVTRFRTSDILREELEKEGRTPTREELQKKAVELEETYGKGYISDQMYKKISESDCDIAIFDAVRWESDFKAVRRFPGGVIVYIFASPETRYLRIITSSQNEKVGEQKMSWEDFLRVSSYQTETTIQEISQKADVKIDNNGDMDQFRDQIKILLHQIMNP